MASHDKTNYAVGDRFWIPDDEHAWLVGTLKEFKNAVLEFNTDKGIKKFRMNDLKTKLEPCGSHVDDHVENLVDLDELSEGAILHHTRIRFMKKQIYTHVGSILVAVNPFENLPIYGIKDMRRAADSSTAYPHVFVTASTAYNQLINNCKNQAVLISGESGAGKTETTKKVLAYLANVAPDHSHMKAGEVGMEEKILQSNPLLEALGNAKTLRNNNSSRFGKWMKVGLSAGFKIRGCEIVNYLLEKSRVVKQSDKERNYHIFYQLLVGADAATKQKLFLKNATDYRYLDQSGCVKIDGVDDVAEFKDVIQAMETLQFSKAMQEGLQRVIAGILTLGNIVFEQGDSSESSKIAAGSLNEVRMSAELLGLDIDAFTYSLTKKRQQMGGRGSVVDMILNKRTAEDSRDTVSKTLYGKLFDWVIAKVNDTLKATGEAPYSIGILDIFGFEVFDLNSFEQLCINYANEKLQLHFNEVIFNEETKMYLDEGVPMDKVDFEDNSLCVQLIEGKPYGLLSLLQEECNLGGATDLSYINKVEKAFGTGKPQANKFFVKNKVKPDCFSVCHFAGAVEYNVANFIEKNKDNLSQTSRECLAQSDMQLVTEMFFEPLEGGGGDTTPVGGGGGGGGSKKKGATGKSTLGAQFREQLIGLLTTLRTTEPHFIRCVKPNHAKVGGQFDGVLALRQLRYAGLFEAIRIRKSGFAYRSNFKSFANNYQILVDGLTARRADAKKPTSDRDACWYILTDMTNQGFFDQGCWHVGTSRVFIKTNFHRTLLERQKVSRVTVFAVRIQQAFRAFKIRLVQFAEVYAAKKEKLRILAEQQEKIDSAVIIQKYWRRKFVRNTMASMQNLIELRRVLAKRETDKIKEVLLRIDASNQHMRDPMLATMFAHEIKVARVMTRLIEIQEKLLDDIAYAVDSSDVPELNRLLLKAERLEMVTHPVVLRARDELLRLHKKRRVLKTMVAFLRNEEECGDTILETLMEARECGVEQEFVNKVQKVYDAAGPRMKTRNKLRTAIEMLDRYNIEQGCLEVLGIQRMQPNFAEAELRAARAVLRLLHFDSQLNPNEEAPTTVIPEASDTFYPLATSRGRTRSRGGGTRSRSGSSDAGNSDAGSAKGSEGGRGGGGVGGPGPGDDANAPPSGGPTSLWDAPILTRPTGAKLNKELVYCCNEIVKARGGASAIKEAKQTLQERCGSLPRLYEVIRYYKWSKCHCTWKFPETQGKSSASSPGLNKSSSRNNYNNSNMDDSLDVQKIIDGAEVENDFYGFRCKDARANTYIIRTLHKDFDLVTGKGSALMQAAVGAAEVPTSIQDQLANLDHIGDVDLDITLPNGTKFIKTKRKHEFNDDPNRSLSAIAPLKPTTTKAPMPIVPSKIIADLPDSSPEKKLYLSRRNKERQMAIVKRDLEVVRRERGTTQKGWK